MVGLHIRALNRAGNTTELSGMIVGFLSILTLLLAVLKICATMCEKNIKEALENIGANIEIRNVPFLSGLET